MNTGHNLTSWHSCLVKERSVFSRNVQMSALIMRPAQAHQSRALPVGPKQHKHTVRRVWSPNSRPLCEIILTRKDGIPHWERNWETSYNMLSKTNQQPIYYLLEDGNITMLSRSASDLLVIRVENCNFLGNIPRVTTGDVITKIWLQMSGTRCVWKIGSKLNVSRYKITRNESVSSWL